MKKNFILISCLAFLSACNNNSIQKEGAEDSKTSISLFSTKKAPKCDDEKIIQKVKEALEEKKATYTKTNIVYGAVSFGQHDDFINKSVIKQVIQNSIDDDLRLCGCEAIVVVDTENFFLENDITYSAQINSQEEIVVKIGELDIFDSIHKG